MVVAGLALILTYSYEKGKGPFITGIAAGYGHSPVLKSDGMLWAWAKNQRDQPGNGNRLDVYIPGQINSIKE